MSGPSERAGVPGWAVLLFIFLCGAALGGGIYYLLKTEPPGSSVGAP